MDPGNPSVIDSECQFGVFCLASDGILDWFQALIRSFRKYNPTLPFTVIPYDTEVSGLNAIREEFNFSIMDESDCCRFDAMGDRISGRQIGPKTLRKLACFFGNYSTFLFLDSDIVVTMCFDELSQAFQDASYDGVYFDLDTPMVYKPEFRREMENTFGSHGFNSGAFFSRKGRIGEKEITDALESAEKIKDRFANWGDQPFINFVFDVTRQRIAHVNALNPDLAVNTWARLPAIFDAKRQAFYNNHGLKLPLVHWAGHEYPMMVKETLFLRFRTLGLPFSGRLAYRFVFYYRRWRQALRQQLVKSRLLARLIDRIRGTTYEKELYPKLAREK